MASQTLKQWVREFREAAKADECSILRRHLRDLGLPDKPELLLEGTILAVIACVAYAEIDGIDGRLIARFLELQKYDPKDSKARYAVTLDLCRKAFARVLAARRFGWLDLADLYNHPWHRYRVSGYHCLWISRASGRRLTRNDITQLKRAVTNDLRFDYPENELDFWFDHEPEIRALRVSLQDRVDE